MTDLLTTFSNKLHTAVLDLLYDQWRALGTPFHSSNKTPHSFNTIDPEALLWCSLEFFPADPRLRVEILEWLARYNRHLWLSRLEKISGASKKDSRYAILIVLKKSRLFGRKIDETAYEQLLSATYGEHSCHTVNSTNELRKCCNTLENEITKLECRDLQSGIPAGPYTSLLRARDVFGCDARHLLLLLLLTFPGGINLHKASRIIGYSYGNVHNIAKGWCEAGIVYCEKGVYGLKDTRPWRDILDLPKSVKLIHWQRFYEAGVVLLRKIKKGIANELRFESPVLHSILCDAWSEIEQSRHKHVDTITALGSKQLTQRILSAFRR